MTTEDLEKLEKGRILYDKIQEADADLTNVSGSTLYSITITDANGARSTISIPSYSEAASDIISDLVAYYAAIKSDLETAFDEL